MGKRNTPLFSSEHASTKTSGPPARSSAATKAKYDRNAPPLEEPVADTKDSKYGLLFSARQTDNYRWCLMCWADLTHNMITMSQVGRYKADLGQTSNIIAHIKKNHSDNPMARKYAPHLFKENNPALQFNEDETNEIRTKKNTEIQHGNIRVFTSEGLDLIQQSISSFSPKKFRQLYIKLVTSSACSWRILTSTELQNLIHFLSPRAATCIPSKSSIANILSSEAQTRKEVVKGIIKCSRTQVSLIIDGWSSHRMKGYFAIMGSMVVVGRKTQKPEIVRWLLAMRRVTSHGSQAMYTVLKEVLQEYNLPLSKISAIVCDNASSNTALVQLLNRELHMTHPLKSIGVVYCFAHSIHRTVLAMISPVQIHIEPLREVVTTLNRSMEYQFLLWSSIKRLNQQENYIKKITCTRIPLDCQTRWSSTHEMIRVFLLLKDAVIDVNLQTSGLKSLHKINWDGLNQNFQFLEGVRVVMDQIMRDTGSLAFVVDAFNTLLDYLQDRKCFVCSSICWGS